MLDDAVDGDDGDSAVSTLRLRRGRRSADEGTGRKGVGDSLQLGAHERPWLPYDRSDGL